MSLVAEPNINSPANVDAAKMWRDKRDEFVKVTKTDKNLKNGYNTCNINI
jgi:ubiquitin-conjugating enzyme E2 G2